MKRDEVHKIISIETLSEKRNLKDKPYKIYYKFTQQREFFLCSMKTIILQLQGCDLIILLYLKILMNSSIIFLINAQAERERFECLTLSLLSHFYQSHKIFQLFMFKFILKNKTRRKKSNSCDKDKKLKMES